LSFLSTGHAQEFLTDDLRNAVFYQLDRIVIGAMPRATCTAPSQLGFLAVVLPSW
jgi:hypothetical protein